MKLEYGSVPLERTRPHYLDDSKLLSGQVFKVDSADLFHIDRFGYCQESCLKLGMGAVFTSLVLFILFIFVIFLVGI